jgi:23S rRNA (guanosine2251-2'-O)-methyltransferase
VEGRQAVRELLRAGRRRVHSLVVAEGADESGALGEILALAADARVTVRRASREHTTSLAATDSAQGVVARADPVPDVALADLTGRSSPGLAPFLVVLDGVTDPHNLGAVMRSALGAGATGVVIPRHRGVGLTPAAVKAAAGAVEYLPVATVPGIPAALTTMAEAGLWTIALDAGSTGSLWDLEVATEPLAVVLGSEGRGVSRLALRRCDVRVAIPIHGPLDSLNVSAAAALACFEVARRRAGWADRAT